MPATATGTFHSGVIVCIIALSLKGLPLVAANTEDTWSEKHSIFDVNRHINPIRDTILNSLST